MKRLVLLMVVLVARPACGVGGGLKTMMGFGMDMLGVTDHLNQLEKAVEDSHKELLGSMDSAQKAVSSKFNALIDKVDDHALEVLFATLFPEVPKDLGNKTCLEGIKATKRDVGTLIMNNGNMTFNKPMKINPVIRKEVGDFMLVEVQLIFPNVMLNYRWSFEPASMVMWNRAGKMKLLQIGPNTVAVVATLPKERSVIDLLIKQKRCFIKVQKMEFRLGHKLLADEIYYPSVVKGAVGVGFTEGYVQDIVLTGRHFIQETFKRKLVDLIAPATTRPDVFCENEIIKPTPVDCSRINEVGANPPTVESAKE